MRQANLSPCYTTRWEEWLLGKVKKQRSKDVILSGCIIN